MWLFRKKSTVRRPTGFEIEGAITTALVRKILSNHIDPGYEQIEQFLHGPLRGAFLQSLNGIVGLDGEYAVLDEKDGLLIKR